jgi:hypothetical protein
LLMAFQTYPAASISLNPLFCRGKSTRGYEPKSSKRPADIIRHAVWLCHRFCLSFREGEVLRVLRQIMPRYLPAGIVFPSLFNMGRAGELGAVVVSAGFSPGYVPSPDSTFTLV